MIDAVPSSNEAVVKLPLRPKVYISGPVSKGNRAHNLVQSYRPQFDLMKAGFAVLNPILTIIMPDEPGLTHEDWMQNDYPWVLCADALLRLPGESDGGDREEGLARKLGIPVYTSVFALIRDKKSLQEQVEHRVERIVSLHLDRRAKA